MAVYKRGEVYHYEFELRGRRLRGATGCTSKREAQEFERAGSGKKRAKEAERREALGRGPLTWGVAATRYWHENGQHHSATTAHPAFSCMAHSVKSVRRRALSDINGSLGRPARREAAGRWRRTDATVNRTMTEALRRVLSRARLWGEHLPPIEWRKHILPEPTRARARVASGGGGGAIRGAAPGVPHHRPFCPAHRLPAGRVHRPTLAGCRLGRARDLDPTGRATS